MEGSHKTHGDALGDDRDRRHPRGHGLARTSPSSCPTRSSSAWRKAGRSGAKDRKAWEARLRSLAPARRLHPRHDGRPARRRLRARWTPRSPRLVADSPPPATRQSSGAALEPLFPAIPEMIGGSADLTGSNNTFVKDTPIFDAPDYDGRYVHYGVREFGMAAAMNGMALHGGRHPLRRHLHGVLRLQPPGDPPGRPDGRARDPRDDPRLHRPGRGRPDPPAGRASGRAAGHAEPDGLPPGRRGRDGRVLAGSPCSTRPTPSVMALSRQKTPAVRDRRAARTCRAKGAYELTAGRRRRPR